MPFAETIPYLKHANAGLSNRSLGTLTDSLKIKQYTYCRLPIIGSSQNQCDKPYMFFYEPGNEASIESAVQNALAFDRSRVPRESVRSWDVLVDELLGNP